MIFEMALPTGNLYSSECRYRCNFYKVGHFVFLDQFWPNFTEMDYYTTPSLWPCVTSQGHTVRWRWWSLV